MFRWLWGGNVCAMEGRGEGAGMDGYGCGVVRGGSVMGDWLVGRWKRVCVSVCVSVRVCVCVCEQ